jgi:aminoglycoside phosphotransferase (APT) family kinase protein
LSDGIGAATPSTVTQITVTVKTVTVEERTSELSASLLGVLRRITGDDGLAYDGAPAALTGGFWAELVTIRLSNAPEGWSGPLVARVMPDAATAAKETVFQAEIAEQGFATPWVLAAGGPAHGVEGRAFMIMTLAEGEPLLAGLDGVRALATLPSLARQLPVTLATVLAALHGLKAAPVEHKLDEAGVAQPRLDAMLDSLRSTSDALGRADLAGAAAWLQAHRPVDEPVVVCHGDMHPFNLLVDDSGNTTVLDWSAAMLASGTYDLGFTSLVLASPPLVVPRALRPVMRAAGRALSRRFVRAYERASGHAVEPASLAWHQGVVCVRALVELAGWVAAGTIDGRDGHPWVIAGDSFAARLTNLTGVAVTPR